MSLVKMTVPSKTGSLEKIAENSERDNRSSSHVDVDEGDHPEVDKSFRVTLEPGLFILLFGLMTATVVFQVLALDKACRVNAGYSGKNSSYINGEIAFCPSWMRFSV